MTYSFVTDSQPGLRDSPFNCDRLMTETASDTLSDACGDVKLQTAKRGGTHVNPPRNFAIKMNQFPAPAPLVAMITNLHRSDFPLLRGGFPHRHPLLLVGEKVPEGRMRGLTENKKMTKRTRLCCVPQQDRKSHEPIWGEKSPHPPRRGTRARPDICPSLTSTV